MSNYSNISSDSLLYMDNNNGHVKSYHKDIVNGQVVFKVDRYSNFMSDDSPNLPCLQYNYNALNREIEKYYMDAPVLAKMRR